MGLGRTLQAQGLVAELKLVGASELGRAVKALADLLGEVASDARGNGPAGDGTGTGGGSIDEREAMLLEAERLMELGESRLNRAGRPRPRTALIGRFKSSERMRIERVKAKQGELGLVFQALGQLDPAFAHYHQAVAIAREFGDKRCR